MTAMDIVLHGGRVIDPATGLDQVSDVLIRDGKIAEVAPRIVPPETSTVRTDVSGLIVGPGFIDLHSHVHSVAGHRLQAFDGVTTSLDLEAGLMPVQRAYREAAQMGRPLNFGFSASWGAARAKILMGVEPNANIESGLTLLDKPDWQRSSSDRELRDWLALLEHELAAGALGIGVLLGYAPRTETGEFLAVARLAAEAGAPTYTHTRELVEADPTTMIDGSEEIAVAAAQTGAIMHHCHVNSTSRRHIDRVLATLEKARSAGSKVTVEAYPYGAASTGVGAYFLDPDRLSAWDLRPSDIILLESGERITDDAHLRQARKKNPAAACIVEFLDERVPSDCALLHSAFSFPDSIVASDAMPIFWPDGVRESLDWPLPAGGSTHPRTAGTFTKALRLMVRESRTWTWLEAFRRCAYLPARLLDQVAPGARDKGHLGGGADADVVVLDPGAVTDTATYLAPVQSAVGVRHLIVAGTFVIRESQLQLDAMPGRPLRGQPR